MVSRRTNVILVGIGVLAIGVVLTNVSRHSADVLAQAPNSPVRVDGKSYIVESNAGQPMYLVLGALRSGNAGRLESARRVQVPFNLVEKIIVYKTEAAFLCEGGRCRPCDPSTFCPGPPPPPPLRSLPVGAGYLGFVFQPSGRSQRPNP